MKTHCREQRLVVVVAERKYTDVPREMLWSPSQPPGPQ